MSMLNVQIPSSLQRHLQELAEREGIAVEQFIANAVSEKMAVLMTDSYLKERAKRGSHAGYEAALAQVRDVEPEERDRLPSS